MKAIHLSRAVIAATFLALLPAVGEVNNLKIVTDASPDYTDLPSLVHSATAKWATPEEKCWAMFYWNHLARRQTNPIMVHGFALTDPIRQFNDYGFAMCSTIAGMNCAIWDAMGLKAKYWDISNHTVAEVEYGGRWHMYDSSMSAIYTLCDGKTIAGVEDIGKTQGCAASHGKVEPGHIARYHCLNATSKNGFLTGADTIRSLEEEFRCFNPNGLKYRSYYYDWDRGHRYILNLRENESYTRHYASLGDSPEFYIPNDNGKDAELNGKFKQRGNGKRTFAPSLTTDALVKQAHSLLNARAAKNGGVEPAKPGEAAEVIFKVEGSNVITSLGIEGSLTRAGADDAVSIAVSTTNGMTWSEVGRGDAIGTNPVSLRLVDEVNGAYEVLVKVSLRAKATPSAAQLTRIAFDATTQLNAKTQPKLNLGKNTVYVGAGDQTGSIVYWPELPGGKAAPFIVEQQNVVFAKENPGYMGTLHAEKAKEDAWVVFRMDAPQDITRIEYGGRFYNRAPKSHIDLLHSFDGGKTWTKTYSLADTNQPWDVIHFETINTVPAGTRSVLFKYLLNSSQAGVSSCSIYAVRMEANHRPADPAAQPVEVTFSWEEVQADRSTVPRSHTELATKLPHKYTINVGGADHPEMQSLRVNLKGVVRDVKYGYSDGRDAGGAKHVDRWITTGNNLAEGKPYTVSVPSETTWEAGDPDGKKLTDGVAGPSYAGGTSYKMGAIWSAKKNPVITLDLGAPTECASFGMNFHGYPWPDAMKGEIKDKVEVLVSDDGSTFKPAGFLQTDLRRKDIPANFMMPDNEKLTGATFRFIPERPIKARHVQYRVTNVRAFDVTELEVLDRIELKPFDLRIALPDEKPVARVP
jgi:hypothetical protein